MNLAVVYVKSIFMSNILFTTQVTERFTFAINGSNFMGDKTFGPWMGLGHTYSNYKLSLLNNRHRKGPKIYEFTP